MRDTTTGQKAARSKGSSPTCPAPCVRGSTSVGTVTAAPYPRDKTTTRRPRPCKCSAMAMVVGVFPVPPALILPMQITGQDARVAFLAQRWRKAVIPPKNRPNGQRPNASMPRGWCQNFGVRIIALALQIQAFAGSTQPTGQLPPRPQTQLAIPLPPYQRSGQAPSERQPSGLNRSQPAGAA